MSDVKDRAEAPWELWERDTFLKLIEKLPTSCRLTISEQPDHVAVMRVWGVRRSVRITFETNDKTPAMYVTRHTEAVDGHPAAREIVWFRGGLREWLDVLEVSRDELISALVNYCEVKP
jgi:hypothetical protein